MRYFYRYTSYTFSKINISLKSVELQPYYSPCNTYFSFPIHKLTSTKNIWFIVQLHELPDHIKTRKNPTRFTPSVKKLLINIEPY